MGYQTIELEISNRGHRDGLLKLWTENMSDTRIAEVVGERVRWFYDENPTAPPRTILSTYGEPAEIIGCGSTFPRRMWVRGQTVEAGIPCDFAVAKRHRIGGAALGIQQALIARSRSAGQGFLFGFPNKLSLPILKRVGYQVVTEANAWVKPLRSIYKLKSYFKNKLTAMGASLVVDAGLRMADLAGSNPTRGRYRREILDRADERFDALWERARAQYPIVGEKTSAFLNWRYAGFKSRQHRFFALVDKHTGWLAGFITFTVEDNKVFIADVFADDLRATLTPLMLRFSRSMRSAGHLSIFINYGGEPWFGRHLESLWFRKANYGDRSMVVHLAENTDPALLAFLRTPTNWLMFDGEMDI